MTNQYKNVISEEVKAAFHKNDALYTDQLNGKGFFGILFAAAKVTPVFAFKATQCVTVVTGDVVKQGVVAEVKLMKKSVDAATLILELRAKAQLKAQQEAQLKAAKAELELKRQRNSKIVADLAAGIVDDKTAFEAEMKELAEASAQEDADMKNVMDAVKAAV